MYNPCVFDQRLLVPSASTTEDLVVGGLPDQRLSSPFSRERPLCMCESL